MAIIFSVVGQKGGTGKSMISRLLAVELVKRKKSVALVDLDIAQRTSAEWGEARKINQLDLLDPAIEVLVIDADEEPDCRVSELANAFSVIILDAPGFSDELTVQIASQADLVVLPSGPSLDDLRPAIRLHHELKTAGIADESIAIALNMIASDAEEKFARSYLGQANLSAVQAVLRDRPSYRKAAGHGQSASEVPHASPRDEASALARVLLERGEASVDRHDQPAEQPKRFVFQEGESW